MAKLFLGILFLGFLGLHAEAQTVRAVTSDSVDSRTQFNFGRSIAIGGSQIVHQVWVETTSILNPGTVTGKIMYRISPDGGVSWTSNKALTGIITTGYPKVAAYGPFVYITYQQAENNLLNVKLLYSKNNGMEWLSAGTAAPSPVTVGLGATPSLAAYGNYFHIAFSNIAASGRSEVYYRGGSVDSTGLKFLAATKMISPDDGRSSWTPDIATEGPSVFMAWTDERNHSIDCAETTSDQCREEVYYRRSHQLGYVWEKEQRLTYSPEGIGHNASGIAVQNGVVHVALFRKEPGQIYYMRLTDNGSVPQPEVPIAVDSQRIFGRPSVAVMGSQVQIAFHGIVPGVGMKMFRIKSIDGGLKFGNYVEIPNTLSFCQQPNIAIDAFGKTHLTFMANTLDGDPNSQVFYVNY